MHVEINEARRDYRALGGNTTLGRCPSKMSDLSDATVSNPDTRSRGYPLLPVEDPVAADDQIKPPMPEPEPPICTAAKNEDSYEGESEDGSASAPRPRLVSACHRLLADLLDATIDEFAVKRRSSLIGCKR
jgi:hypothetical protein